MSSALFNWKLLRILSCHPYKSLDVALNVLVSLHPHFTVKQGLIDEGGELINRGMENRYAKKCFERVSLGPKNSQLNLCERTQRSLMRIMKATMEITGFPIGLWPDCVILVYNKGTMGIPYQMMFDIKPDVHHIRKFGALAYLHVPATSGRRKLYQNAKICEMTRYYNPVRHRSQLMPGCQYAAREGEIAGHELMDPDCADTEYPHITNDNANAQYETIGKQNQDWNWTSATANVFGNEETASEAATQILFSYRRESSVGEEDLGDADEPDLGDDNDGDITVSSVF
ncbi:Integrase catalytic core protein [Phytophthora palmivora]|uniref:Integrase catalytic core protein n=1 Tax=Phytophthora palmivora TaxID=4796 RepID=A0A2P4YJM8_9STRA|nr:Integrase catalytic core protein [Phytophthora palmivora]